MVAFGTAAGTARSAVPPREIATRASVPSPMSAIDFHFAATGTSMRIVVTRYGLVNAIVVDRSTLRVKSAIVTSTLCVCSEVTRPGMSVTTYSGFTCSASASRLAMSMS